MPLLLMGEGERDEFTMVGFVIVVFRGFLSQTLSFTKQVV